MRDRESARPGRIKITMDDGQVIYGMLEMADSPTNPGTPWSKAAVLTDSTAASLGLNPESDPTPNDAFGVLASTRTEAKQAKQTANDALEKASAAEIAGSVVNFEGFSNGPSELKRLEIDALTPQGGRYVGASGSIGKYAVFAGGISGPDDKVSDIVDAYDETFAKVGVNRLSVARSGIGSSRNPGYLLFAGGSLDRVPGEYSYPESSVVDAYDENLTRTLAPSIPGAVQGDRGGASGIIGANAGNYAVFTIYGTTWAYNSAMTLVQCPQYPEFSSTIGCSAVSFNGHAFFCGEGTKRYESSKTMIISPSLTLIKNVEISIARIFGGLAANENYILYAGGVSMNDRKQETYYDTVDAFDKSFVRTQAPAISIARGCGNSAFSTGKIAVFAGGFNADSDLYNTDAYDNYLTKTQINQINEGERINHPVSMNGKAVVPVGSGKMSAYVENMGYSIVVPALSAYKFAPNLQEEITLVDKPLSGEGTLDGYIRKGGFTLRGNY